MTPDGGLGAFALDDEIVTLGLATDGFVDGIVEQDTARVVAECGTEIGGVFLSEAHE
tara:strand:+ start:910 stop:1080 length:171 start_codon:yes stop_codon:yes gene_type:complete